MADKIFVGRRKNAIARVLLRNGSGKIVINNKPLETYFPILFHQEDILLPFQLTETVGKYDVHVTADGGGISGQSEAIRLGISRALVDINPEYRPMLKKDGLLSRDPRMVERKKYGRPKARKRFQFSKR
ncbi:MAG: 30S ribosomal protein S9 [Ignavibacteriales bacterium]|nr:30S ribosomal protein S9 [Ignavibacteriales bacterium]MCF8305359.1 30S ribosomal protein S9 [Ignavibacteriales bacterium]MCF8436544.1 30S ribosomal protein S9 [Ignavibacteriales bacterium]